MPDMYLNVVGVTVSTLNGSKTFLTEDLVGWKDLTKMTYSNLL